MTGAAADSSFGITPEWMVAAWVFAGGFGRESGTLERMVIQGAPGLLGRVKSPVKTTSAGRFITWPGRAVSRAL